MLLGIISLLDNMVVLSANKSLERALLSDRGFICSHLTPYLSTLAGNEISGQTLEPYLVGKMLNTYESIGQSRPLHLVAESVKALDSLIENPALLKERESLQTVLSTEESTRPIVGLASIIMLDRLARLDLISAYKGNVLESCHAKTDFDCVVELPTYISYLPHEFCAEMDDIDTEFDYGSDNNEVALYIPYQVAITPSVEVRFQTTVHKQDWVYRLINHYTQGHYKLNAACARAQKRPYAFALIVASMLGIGLDKLNAYSVEDYTNQTDMQKYDFLTITKPLIEHIAYDFINSELISL